MMDERTTSVELTDWERRRLGLHAASGYLTYFGHQKNGVQLSESEIAEMRRWEALADKLNDKEPA